MFVLMTVIEYRRNIAIKRIKIMNFLTVSDIARSLEVDRDAVAYAIRKARIEPAGRAGLVRLFPASTLVSVRDFIGSKRQSRKEIAKCTA